MESAERMPIWGLGSEAPAGSRGRAPGTAPEGGDILCCKYYDFTSNSLHEKHNQIAISSHEQ
jgi:hypothetical protein